MSVERDRIGHEESQPRDPKHFTLNLCLILRASLLPLAKYYITLMLFTPTYITTGH